MQYKHEQFSTHVKNPPDCKMVKVVVALCIVAAVQVCSAYEVAVPVFKQPYGTGETRIVGGQMAAPGQFPHQAAVTMDDQGFCGGSLISKNWVLTAAHCVDRFSTWSVVLGALNISNCDDDCRLVTVASNKGIRHENYDSRILANDVGVIRLPQEVQLTETINTIKLPPKSYQNHNFTGQTVRVSGWGRTSDDISVRSEPLLFVDLTIISLEECNAVYGNSLTKTQYCCSGVDLKGVCNGDSGGPLTIGSGENLTQLGVVSFGNGQGCAKGYPTGYSATPFFVEWISEKTGIPVSDF